MRRAVEEWIGATPNAKVPPRVRVRIFDRDKGRCHATGRRIQAGEPWELDHIIALINGGEHRESNLAPILIDKHREKTARDIEEKSRIAAKRAKHIGVVKSRTPLPGSRAHYSKLRKNMRGEISRW